MSLSLSECEKSMEGSASPSLPDAAPSIPLSQTRPMSLRRKRDDGRWHAETERTNLEHLSRLAVSDSPDLIRKTGIVCTLGPSCEKVETLKEMIAEGMNIARLNFSHGTHEYHTLLATRLREALAAFPSRHVALALDTKGTEIRTGHLRADLRKRGVVLEAGASFFFTRDKAREGKGTEEGVFVDFGLDEIVEEGGEVLLDDGLLLLRVLKKESGCVDCRVEQGGILFCRRGVRVPGMHSKLPEVNAKDVEDIRFGLDLDIDMIFASFTKDAQSIRHLRRLLGSRGREVAVIAKIESQDALDNLDDIISVADGVMVARGDLGIEIPPAKVALAQKLIISRCNKVGKPVICATQMLESMIEHARGTRAECGDIANAVLDGADCVMLSGETAVGQHPVEAVSVMHRVCKEAEAAFYSLRFFSDMSVAREGLRGITETIARAATNAVFFSHAAAILLVTESGKSAMACAHFRPPVPIVAVCSKERVARQLLLHRGVFPVYQAVGGESWAEDQQSRLVNGIRAGKERGFIFSGDVLVVISGWRQDLGHANMLRIVHAT